MIDCPIQSGQENDYNRSKLEHVMSTLPNNQSGEGRHKCPYCAYNKGYKQALQDLISHCEISYRNREERTDS